MFYISYATSIGITITHLRTALIYVFSMRHAFYFYEM